MAKLLARPTAAEDDLLAQYRTVCTHFDPQRVELIHGRIVVSPMPTGLHNNIIALLLFQLTGFLMERDWRPWTNIKLFMGTQTDRFIPDLVVVSKRPRMWGQDEVYADDTHLVVEVVSPSSVNDDYHDKPAAYAAAGVPLFLRIDPIKSTADLFALPAEGAFTHHTEVTFGAGLALPAPWNLTLDTAVFNDAEPTEDQPG
ncbi:Uma2 family endonuclease [Nonomuraea typhae]|uniref:Uma2 family endonuclease n=1 Tax=Nonomuraea typhae TaxID=2603600 RepID=UPI0012FC8961|nr:Uma2 family endonuclease [Nonomuraea typhae]